MTKKAKIKMTSKEELESYFKKQNLKLSIKRKENKLYITDINNNTEEIDVSDKNVFDILKHFYQANKTKKINSSKDFTLKFNESFKSLSDTPENLEKEVKLKKSNNNKKLLSVYFVDIVNFMLREFNVLNLNKNIIDSLPEKTYPYVKIDDRSEKIVVDLSYVLYDYKNDRSNIIKSSPLKKRYEISESVFLLNKAKFNSMVSYLKKVNIDREDKVKDFLSLINLVFEKTSYKNRSTRSNKSYSYGDEEKYQEITISNYEEALNNDFSGSPKSIFKALEKLKINYKDPNNAHFSGKLIARIIIEGLGKEFVWRRTHKFAQDPNDKRIYMDISVKGKKKFLWCGATIAFMFKDILSPSIRKAFRGTSALFYSFGNDKDICVYKRSDGYYPTERQLKADDVICISSNNSGESGGKSSQKFGNHIGVISSVNIVNGRVKSVKTYEGNTYKGGRNTVAQRTRSVDEIVIAYRLMDNEKISSKYELFNSAFPGMKTNDYQILYSIFFTNRIKKLNTPEKIVKYMTKKKKATIFNKKYLTNKETTQQTKQTILNLLNKLT
jgi:hypothetical protein